MDEEVIERTTLGIPELPMVADCAPCTTWDRPIQVSHRKGEVPSGYIPVRPRTYNTYTLVRSILASNSEEDVHNGDALVKQIKLYPLSQAANPPQQRFVDMTDILYEGLAHYDASFYTSLARMLNEEPVQPRDLE